MARDKILPSLSEGKTEPPTTKISSPKPSNRLSWLQNYGEIVVCVAVAYSIRSNIIVTPSLL